MNKFLILFAVSALFLGCNDKPTEPEDISCSPSSGLIEMTAPTAGSVWNVGDTVTLKWRATVDDFAGFRPQVSLDDGRSYTDIAAESVFAEGTAGDHCVTFDYIVPEGETNSQVKFRVRDYSSPSPDMRADIGPVTFRNP